MEAIMMFLAYACSRKIKVYQMDVKSSFQNGELEEEVYIEQPKGFLLIDKENYVCRLKKALYGLKQAPRAWYAHLDRYLHQPEFKEGSADNNLYVKVDQDNPTIIEVYVDDIIFGSNDDRLSKDFATKMQRHNDNGVWYPKGNDLVIQTYIDADWEGSVDDRKSTSGATFDLSGCLVSWLNKKKPSISLSTTEAEYIAAKISCTKVLWMKQTLQDLQVKFDEPIPMFCDNTYAISMSKNLVMHSKMKHIPIKYHFFREQVAEKNIKLEYVGRKEQIANIFTKPLARE
eukprot:PITA_08832